MRKQRKPPTQDQQMFAFMAGYFGGIALFAIGALVFLRFYY